MDLNETRERIIFEKAGPIAKITLNWPEKANAQDQKQVEDHEDILDIGHQVRSILDQFVDAHTSRGVNTIGYAKDITPLFEGKIGRDQRSALFGRLCHQDAQRET